MSSDLRLDADLKTATTDAEHLLVVGSLRALRRVRWGSLSRAGWTKTTSRLVSELAGSAGGPSAGGAATTLCAGRGPARASVVALPDEVSRHLSPSRSHAVGRLVGKLPLPDSGRVGVLLVLDEAEHLLPLALALSRLAPRYDRRSGAAGRRLDVAAVLSDGTPVEADRATRGTVDAARWAADMVDRPAEECTTEAFADEARSLFGRLRSVAARLVVGDELLEAGLGAVHAVGRAAVVPPRLLVLERDAAGGEQRTVALVGKGIVYDTGGLALKGREGMTAMKSDMGGAAAVVGAFSVLARERLPARLLAVVPLAENAIGPASYRHGDILTMHSGKTVEINNTDAEGRLLLHDAVSHAVRDLGADVVIDAATLTGAQGVATGKTHAAVATDSPELEQAAVEAGLATGDVVHPVLYAPELHAPEFRSEVADLRNSVRDRRNAQVGCAAWFVHQGLADTAAAWLHVDLASPAFPEERATGYGVALLAELVRRHLAESR